MSKITKLILTAFLASLFIIIQPVSALETKDQYCEPTDPSNPSDFRDVIEQGPLYQSFKPSYNRITSVKLMLRNTGKVKVAIMSYSNGWAYVTTPANITLNGNGNIATYFYSINSPSGVAVDTTKTYYVMITDNNPTTAEDAHWALMSSSSCYSQGAGADRNGQIGDYVFTTYGYNYTASSGSTPTSGGSTGSGSTGSSGTSGSSGTGSTGGSSSDSGSVSSADATATAVAGGSSSDGSSAVGNINDYPVPIGDDEGLFGGSFLGGMGMFFLIPLAGFTLFLIFIVVLLIILKRRKRLQENQKKEKVDDSTKNRTQT